MPNINVEVVGPDDYALVVVVGRDGHANVTGTLSKKSTASVLGTLTAAYHQEHALPLDVTDDLAALLTAAGWTPPKEAA